MVIAVLLDSPAARPSAPSGDNMFPTPPADPVGTALAALVSGAAKREPVSASVVPHAWGTLSELTRAPDPTAARTGADSTVDREPGIVRAVRNAPSAAAAIAWEPPLVNPLAMLCNELMREKA